MARRSAIMSGRRASASLGQVGGWGGIWGALGLGIGGWVGFWGGGGEGVWGVFGGGWGVGVGGWFGFWGGGGEGGLGFWGWGFGVGTGSRELGGTALPRAVRWTAPPPLPLPTGGRG